MRTLVLPSDFLRTNVLEEIVEVINALNLPRYGLGNYIAKKPTQKPTEAEQRQLNALFRGGRRLMGFSRTNLFKRLESSGSAFIQSIERHILRNFIYLYAIDQNFDIPAPRMQTCWIPATAMKMLTS